MLHAPQVELPQEDALTAGTALRAASSASKLRERTSAASSSITCRSLLPGQYSQSPCSGTSTSNISARRCAVWQRKSTGVSASPASSSPLAAHCPHSERSAQRVHFVIRDAFFARTLRRNFSHPSLKVPVRTLYSSTCDNTQMVRFP